MFVAPWCKRCTLLEDHFIRAATILREHEEEPIFFAKIDGDFNKKISNALNIKSYPHFRMYKKGEHIKFIGYQDTFYDFYNWIFKK